MLIDFRTLFPRFDIKPTGVLHIGANVGEEFPVYNELGIKKQIWIEGNTDIFLKLKQNISSNPEATAFNFIIGDRDGECKFNISNNGSQSSSVLELGTHKIAHPEVHYVASLNSTMHRIDSLFYNGKLPTANIGLYDFLNIDLQGAELMALKGMGELLRGFKWAYLEVNKAELYEGCAMIEDLDFYLLGFGFKRVETSWCGNTNWGDALYVKGL